MAFEVNGISSALAGLAGAADVGASTSAARAATGLPDREDFMRLLLTQIQNQNPLEPVQDTEFIAQLTQFASLDQLDSLNRSFQSLLTLQQLTQGASLIGKRVSYVVEGSTTPQQGTVDAVNLNNGQAQLLVNGTNVSLDQVRGLTA